MSFSRLIWAAVICGGLAFGQPEESIYKLALANHNGSLKWTAEGFTIAQNSAKGNGSEIGVRARDASGRLTLLGFLFLVPEDAPLTSAKCRDGAIAQEQRTRPGMQILGTTEIQREHDLPVALASYSWKTKGGTPGYTVRGFVATGELCGDLEFDSPKPISAGDADLKGVLASFQLDPSYVPQFRDVLLYAQVLYQNQSYPASATLLKKALAMIPADGAPFGSAKIAKRAVTDQAGMAYGLAGDIAQARAILALGISEDPDYPLYYYNLACADAAEKKLPEAERHLQQAWERKQNLNAGETMPDPATDDSFTPYRDNAEFWAFVVSLETGK